MTKPVWTGRKDFTRYYKEDRSLYGGGSELTNKALRSLTPEQKGRLWTLIDADCTGRLYIVAGYHYVNRLAHIMSTKPWASEDEMYAGGREVA